MVPIKKGKNPLNVPKTNRYLKPFQVFSRINVDTAPSISRESKVVISIFFKLVILQLGKSISFPQPPHLIINNLTIINHFSDDIHKKLTIIGSNTFLQLFYTH